ncbi:uncharacterized protein TRIADDRAFT_60317 [Trichoplax adhaerens]|uniref:CRAL-TRIO domain-containing protein n=1 Tax=Trichoplax adhaerens TaxID=10228 RepID=B3S7W3_TRIAD|nr:hypothetical protein TRIADDRAFT_60317 [Trichoplax adhaerens]EDV21366.1 hypothetical protein TRIADDRAFT_60317 [Trichoplax adhaerens]|eukprot:XP_002116333.1 hypothetical protein TRIADDRAFT_60317 [Trichoplax adhaerens]
MSGHVGNLSLQQQEALNKFRLRFTNILPPEELDDDYFLLRWLRARDFNLQKSEEMLKKNCRFRKEWKIDRLVAEDNVPELWRTYYPGDYIGYDKDEAPIFLLNIGKFDVKGVFLSMKADEITKHALAVAEKGMQLCERQSKKLGKRIEGVTVIEDMAGMPMTGFYKPAIAHFTKVLGMFEDNYPEFMKHAFIINADHLQILEQYVDKDFIPKALGGNLTDENGDPHCSAIVGSGGNVPRSLYRSELIKESARPLDDYSSVVIARGDSLKLNYNIETSGALLKWEFKTDYYNIGFGVIKVFRNDDGSEENYEVIPVIRRNCQIVIEEGSYLCEDPGTYILHFDNSFSWITSKKLYYIIEVLPPDEAVPNNFDIELNNSLSDKPIVNENGE